MYEYEEMLHKFMRNENEFILKLIKVLILKTKCHFSNVGLNLILPGDIKIIIEIVYISKQEYKKWTIILKIP